ncbi:MAG: hypothetical protein JWO36_5918 [Myxococcales bacterium]|nr:hypothetical protein [Myxococcales bacterium]
MRQVGVFVAWFVAIGCGRGRFDILPQGDDDQGGAGDGGRLGDGGGPSDALFADGNNLPATSCVGLAATCGIFGNLPCCTSPLVPGGMFYRGYDVGTDAFYNDMTKPSTVSAFRLDTYEVTVGRFRKFVLAGMGTVQNPPPANAGGRMLNGLASQGGWDPSWNGHLPADTAGLIAELNCDATRQSWTNAPGANESKPINCINWYVAMAFCVWDNGFLPTEAQWMFAAGGGSEQRAYAWSNPPSSLAIDCTYANYNYCVGSPNGSVNRVGSESPKGDGKWGQADLEGNLWEWALDWAAFYTNPCDDCANLTPALGRAKRGGYFRDVAGYVRVQEDSESYAPDIFTLEGGVRCARAP